jgi:pimeloyl-ACP methyl ester carboxylesterase
MHGFARVCAAGLAALTLLGCASKPEIDSGAGIRLLMAQPPEQTAPKDIHIVTTRCDEDPRTAPATAESAYLQKRCWDFVRDEPEVLELGFGMADGGRTACARAPVIVPPPDIDPAVSPPPVTLTRYDCGARFESLRRAILATPCQCALIFVHGYNTTFPFAVRRTAQLRKDLDAEGVAIAFSPAAAGITADYASDLQAFELAAPALNRLLTALSAPNGGIRPKIDVVAHSMGARLTLRAMTEGSPPALRTLVLPAADVEPAYFLRQARQAAPHYEKLIVYAAANDIALKASKAAHNDWARVGLGLEPGLGADLAKAEFIDATMVSDSFFRHSYFAESGPVVSDLKLALRQVPAAQRPPLACRVEAGGGPARCEFPCPEGRSCTLSFFERLLNAFLD